MSSHNSSATVNDPRQLSSAKPYVVSPENLPIYYSGFLAIIFGVAGVMFRTQEERKSPEKRLWPEKTKIRESEGMIFRRKWWRGRSKGKEMVEGKRLWPEKMKFSFPSLFPVSSSHNRAFGYDFWKEMVEGKNHA